MLIHKRVIQDVYTIQRQGRLEVLIELYDNVKDAILDVEKRDDVKESYFSKEAQLKKQMDKELQELLKIKDTELDVLKSQIKSMKSLEKNFKELKDNYKNIQKIAKNKDEQIKNLEIKIKQVESKD